MSQYFFKRKDKLRDYRLSELIQEKANKQIWLASNSNSENLYLLKITEMKPGDQNAFQDIGNYISELSHPQIIRYFQCFFDIQIDKKFKVEVMQYFQNSIYLDEYIANTSNDEFLEGGMHDTLDLAIQMVSGIDYLHKKGLIHRNISPQSILIQGKKIKIAGLQYAVRKQNKQVWKHHPQSYYIAPEVIRGKDYDESADFYALGLIFQQMILKRRLFRGIKPPKYDYQQKIHQILENQMEKSKFKQIYHAMTHVNISLRLSGQEIKITLEDMLKNLPSKQDYQTKLKQNCGSIRDSAGRTRLKRKPAVIYHLPLFLNQKTNVLDYPNLQLFEKSFLSLGNFNLALAYVSQKTEYFNITVSNKQKKKFFQITYVYDNLPSQIKGNYFSLYSLYKDIAKGDYNLMRITPFGELQFQGNSVRRRENKSKMFDKNQRLNIEIRPFKAYPKVTNKKNKEILLKQFSFFLLNKKNSLSIQQIHELQQRIKVLDQLRDYNRSSESIGEKYEYLGLQFCCKGQLNKSYYYYKKAIEIYHNSQSFSSSAVADIYHNIALLYCLKNNGKQALYYCKQSLQIKKKKPKNQISCSSTLALMGNIFLSNFSDFKEAEYYYRKAIEVLETTGKSQHQLIFQIYNSLGILHYKSKQLGKSIQAYERCLEVRNLIQQKTNQQESLILYNLGNCYLALQKFEKCLQYYSDSLSNYQKGEQTKGPGLYFLKIEIFKKVIKILKNMKEAESSDVLYGIKKFILQFQLNLMPECPEGLIRICQS